MSRRVLTLSCCILTGGITGCGEEDDGVTYADDVFPLFNERCTICHRPGSPIGVDIQNPYVPGTGLVDSPNSWAAPDAYPGLTPELNVMPGNPDESFLLWKLGDPQVPALPPEGGDPMPLVLDPLTAEELQAVETWVSDGAQNDQFFADNVRPIFGDENRIGAAAGKCIYCHYEGAPKPPDLTNPFDLGNGVVSVPASSREGILRVAPGSPDDSYLVLKVRATEADSLLGAPMPYVHDPLTPREIETVRQWIIEGARP